MGSDVADGDGVGVADGDGVGVADGDGVGVADGVGVGARRGSDVCCLPRSTSGLSPPFTAGCASAAPRVSEPSLPLA